MQKLGNEGGSMSLLYKDKRQSRGWCAENDNYSVPVLFYVKLSGSVLVVLKRNNKTSGQTAILTTI